MNSYDGTHTHTHTHHHHHHHHHRHQRHPWRPCRRQDPSGDAEQCRANLLGRKASKWREIQTVLGQRGRGRALRLRIVDDGTNARVRPKPSRSKRAARADRLDRWRLSGISVLGARPFLVKAIRAAAGVCTGTQNSQGAWQPRRIGVCEQQR